MHLKLRHVSTQSPRTAERPCRWQGRSQDWKCQACGPALWAFALSYYHSAARFQSRPGPPLWGGPVHFSLDGGRSGGVPFPKGQRLPLGSAEFAVGRRLFPLGRGLDGCLVPLLDDGNVGLDPGTHPKLPPPALDRLIDGLNFRKRRKGGVLGALPLTSGICATNSMLARTLTPPASI